MSFPSSSSRTPLTSRWSFQMRFGNCVPWKTSSFSSFHYVLEQSVEWPRWKIWILFQILWHQIWLCILLHELVLVFELEKVVSMWSILQAAHRFGVPWRLHLQLHNPSKGLCRIAGNFLTNNALLPLTFLAIIIQALWSIDPFFRQHIDLVFHDAFICNSIIQVKYFGLWRM